MIKVGDTVRVTSEGIFNGQEVKVLKIETDRGGNVWYRLNTVWRDKGSYPGWFERHEIEPVEAAYGRQLESEDGR